MISPAGRRIWLWFSRGRNGVMGVATGSIEPQWLLVLTRVAMVSGFVLAAWRWGDWRHWQVYYPTVLFVTTVNFFASYVSYLHPLWIFGPDALVRSETAIELISTFVVMPASVFTYLSNFPAAGRVRQGAYFAMWVGVFAARETVDTRRGGISSASGGSLAHALAFESAMFAIILLHHRRPLYGWLATVAMAVYILTAFGFWGAEMK